MLEINSDDEKRESIYLSITEQNTVEQAENAVKEHKAFVTTLDANEEKINTILSTGQGLLKDGNYAGNKIQQKIDSAKER